MTISEVALGEHVPNSDVAKSAVDRLLAVCDESESYVAWQKAAAMLPKILKSDLLVAKRRAKIWLCSSFTVTNLSPLIRLAALRIGIDLEIHEGGYNQYRQEVIDPASAMYQAQPDFIVIACHEADLNLPTCSQDPHHEVDKEAARWMSLWSDIKERSSATIIMFNFAVPMETPFGHLTRGMEGSRCRMIDDLNNRLASAASGSVSVLDCDRLSALIGKRTWFDDRYWFLSKQAIAPKALPLVAKHLAAVLASRIGLAKKCLAVDLDNTLWGGVVGELGPTGVLIGPDSAEGEGYAGIQKHLLSLKERGILLAVCSKNNPEDAREVFDTRQEMILRLSDFVAFQANWEPKWITLQTIASQLDIALDSIVFLDDNPVEREAIRQLLPEVEVLALPENPLGFRRVLAECTWFEPVALTTEDIKRTDQYRARAESSELRSRAENLEDYFKSLAMRARLQPVQESTITRTVQLINKTNQFNLTLRRYSEGQVRAMMLDGNYLLWTVHLTDTFADHGLVGVFGLQVHEDGLEIHLLALSCRVIGRTLEHLIINQIISLARERGVQVVKASYVTGPKNSLVANLYSGFGFEPIRAATDNEHLYFVATEGWRPLTTYVKPESMVNSNETSCISGEE